MTKYINRSLPFTFFCFFIILGPIATNVKGKRIILIDDSIVRGNTIGPIIKLLRRAGATEVHIRVASPPLKHPCYMGINIPTKQELIANDLDSKSLAEKVGKYFINHCMGSFVYMLINLRLYMYTRC